MLDDDDPGGSPISSTVTTTPNVATPADVHQIVERATQLPNLPAEVASQIRQQATEPQPQHFLQWLTAALEAVSDERPEPIMCDCGAP